VNKTISIFVADAFDSITGGSVIGGVATTSTGRIDAAFHLPENSQTVLPW